MVMAMMGSNNLMALVERDLRQADLPIRRERKEFHGQRKNTSKFPYVFILLVNFLLEWELI
jgi:hypothetical protein